MSLFPKSEYNSTYEIPFEHLFSQGVRGVIFDIDNTLVLHDEPADDRSIKLFEKLRNTGLKTCIISNNEEPRVKAFANTVGSKYVYKAGKPLSKGYIKALELLGTDRKNTVFVGDQLFTDIAGANNAGIYSILVKPIGKEKYFHIILKRILEAPILFFYHLYCKIY